ncbi:MAG: hypothetical protein H0U35_12010 [Sporichthyaceae bacterium]|nr:hypothetical protein [Sporichthyaceae bacterium]
MTRSPRRAALALLAAGGLVLAAPGFASGDAGASGGASDVMPVPDAQHGPSDGHLIGSGAWGGVELVSKEEVTQTEGLVADVAVSPDGMWAYLANWGEPDCAGPETGGQTSPDAGAWVISLEDLSNPETVGFIPSHQDTRPGEGMQVVNITTKQFSGDVLVMNNEPCGKNGKGGISMWDVTDPLKPKRIAENFGDTGSIPGVNQTHSAFAWDAGDRAYLVAQDSNESAETDLDIFDITNPKRPRLIAEVALNDFDVDQPDIGLTDSDLHDMTVKYIEGHWILLASYWDGGYVQLNVDDPANPVFIGDTDFTNPDPELFESTGAELTPEGNAHQAEYTSDNKYFIATDEDFGPYRADDFKIVTGPYAGEYPSVIVPGALAPAALDDLTLNGPTVYGGYGCPDSAAIPTPESIPGYLDSLEADEEKIIVLQRGPSGDPSAPEGACFPGEKAHEAALAGWDAVVFVSRHTADDSVPFCGSGAFVDPIVGICTTHEAFHKMFNAEPVTGPWTYPDGPAIGTIGAEIEVGSIFDGWGYVHLYDRTTMKELDTWAVDEAHDPTYAIGYGDLSVHEVATSQVDPDIAYYSYYAAGFRVTEIQGTELVEVGGYLAPDGNNFWGVEVFQRDGKEYVAASDRDFGLYIFKYNPTP